MEVASSFNHAAALSACAQGDEAAFHRLFDHEAPRMLALCRRQTPSNAEDLLHDTFALIWRHADQYDSSMGSARAWIYSVLRHLARQRRIQHNEVPPINAPWLPPTPKESGRLKELTQADESAYQAIAHAYLDGASYGRISGWLKRSEFELKKTTRRCLGELAE